MGFTNILVGSDGSSLMEAVFDECVYLAQLTGATIHVRFRHNGLWGPAC